MPFIHFRLLRSGQASVDGRKLELLLSEAENACISYMRREWKILHTYTESYLFLLASRGDMIHVAASISILCRIAGGDQVTTDRFGITLPGS